MCRNNLRKQWDSRPLSLKESTLPLEELPFRRDRYAGPSTECDLGRAPPPNHSYLTGPRDLLTLNLQTEHSTQNSHPEAKCRDNPIGSRFAPSGGS